jgi:hypothetical protein
LNVTGKGFTASTNEASKSKSPEETNHEVGKSFPTPNQKTQKAQAEGT